MTYQQRAIRRRGTTLELAAGRRNRGVLSMGWADPRHRAAWLVVTVSLPADPASSLHLAQLAARPSAALWACGEGL